MLFHIVATFFTPVHRLKEFCRSSQHEFALHVHSLKKECCTWLCAFLPMSCRVQIQGEKLCRIICKFDREANQETDALPTCIQLLLGVFINLVKKQFWRGEFFFFYCTQNLHAHFAMPLRLWCKPVKCMGPEIKVYWKIEVESDLANITVGRTEVRLGRWPGNIRKSHAPSSFFNFNSVWPFWRGVGGKLMWSTSPVLTFLKTCLFILILLAFKVDQC